jgi:hypothetical protein
MLVRHNLVRADDIISSVFAHFAPDCPACCLRKMPPSRRATRLVQGASAAARALAPEPATHLIDPPSAKHKVAKERALVRAGGGKSESSSGEHSIVRV